MEEQEVITIEDLFYNDRKAMLEENFNVKVISITEYDKEGKVFGIPSEIDLDIIVKNDTLIICEIKFSMSRGDMYIFEKKVKYYEEKHNCKANRIIVISPMIDKKALEFAQELNIKCYSYTDDIEKL